MLFCFISIRGSNYFMTELLSVVAAAVSAAGHEVDFAFDEFPEISPDGVYVVIPHEFHGLAHPRSFPSRAQCRRTLALCTENPGTVWFEDTSRLVPHFGATLAINRSSANELRRRGIECEHFQLGYSRLWDSWHRDEAATRPIDVLYLGARDARRDALLAGYGRQLWERRCEFLVPALESRGIPSPEYLTGVEKHHRLRSSRLLINLHRSGSHSFEWVRFLEAACNGCVVLSERCTDHRPLVPGEHFIAAGAGSLPFLAGQLLDDPDRLRSVALAAYDYVCEELPMGPSVERVAALAADILVRDTEHHAVPEDGATPLPRPPSPSPGPPPSPEQQALERQGVAIRALSIETRELRRELGELTHRATTGRSTEARVVSRTPAYEEAAPRVSVAITLHNYEREILDALSSIAASSFVDFEALVINDASTDDSEAAAASFLEAHPWLPAMLLRQPVNRGLARSRNELVQHARGQYVFILDADNGVYPPALARLVAALDADADATFAYGMITMYEGGQPFSLLSGFPWDPARLRRGNFIDAMALIKREHLLRLGGYTTDPRLTGWEDFHLWCQCAEAGNHGVLVPQVLAWYRRRHHSMLLTETEISTTTAWSLMRERFPDLLADVPGAMARAPT
ncbi:MAG TPA: glycosyltransferase [Solirubrobacteraceae bacterium]|jgi:hypothetical protein|nr:glycosyltransferase [Solirubrobacteraceae bacterium]